MRSLALLLCWSALSAAALAQGAIRATVTQHGDGGQTTTVVDPEKQTAEEVVTDGSKKVVRKTTYLLDERNQPIAGIVHDAAGKVLYRASYKRDGAGRIEEENVTTEAGAFIRRRAYIYGSDNKVVQLADYDANGNLMQTSNRLKGGGASAPVAAQPTVPGAVPRALPASPAGGATSRSKLPSAQSRRGGGSIKIAPVER